MNKLFTLPLAAALLTACGSDNTPTTAVDLKFTPEIAGQPFRCQSEYGGMGNGVTQTYRATDFRWFISDLELVDARGVASRVRLDDTADGLTYQDTDSSVALLGQIDGCSGADSQQNLRLSGSAAGTDFVEACFTLGVPFALNHLDASADTTPSPLNIQAMNWNWRGGHKFLKIDGLAELQGDGSGTAFNFHLGSTGCESESATNAPTGECTFPNTPRYCVDLAALQSGRAITVDPARLASATDMGFNTEGTAPGCMGFPNDPECADIMPKHGLNYMLNGNLIPAQQPLLFALEAAVQ